MGGAGGGGGYDQEWPIREAPPGSTYLTLQVYERVGISLHFGLERKDFLAEKKKTTTFPGYMM